MNVGFISLGCSKNLVDTEIIIGMFKKRKCKIVNNPEIADIIIINTCGFIEPAKEEAINTILEMAMYKEKNCKKLIVTGCLVERYKDELIKELPEVDLFIKFSEYDNIENIIDNIIFRMRIDNKTEFNKLNNYIDRVITTGEKTAYIKIAEGCSNKCTYCAIPYIRGPLKSRRIEEVLTEANNLANKGYEEIILIAQDTTKYGIDIYGESKLDYLLNEISKIEEIKWIRFLYAYPETITDELIRVVKENEKICKYFDIPLQHISNSVLKRMNRKSNEESIIELINKIRFEIPEAVLRTSLIVGFPGETKEDFEKLYNFVKEVKFDKLGIFMYSKEDGTPAEKLQNQLHGNTKKARYNKVMQLQQQISKQNLEKRIGNIYEVVIVNITKDQGYLVGRTNMDVPEMDGVIYIKNNYDKDLINCFTKCKITDIKDNYDLIAEII